MEDFIKGMKEYTSSSPEFSDSIKVLDVDTPNHAEGVNVATRQILDNTVALKNELACNLLYIEDFSNGNSTGGTHCYNGNYGCYIPSENVTVWSGEIVLPEGGYAYPASSDTADVIVAYTLDGEECQVEISGGAVLPEGAVVTEYRLERKKGESRIVANIWPMISPGKRAVPEFVEYTGDGRRMNECVADIVAPRYSMPEVRKNLTSGERLKKALGKIGRFFNDLKEVAFSGSYNDLEDKPSAEDIGAAPFGVIENGDFNDMTIPGIYTMHNTSKNAPNNNGCFGLLVLSSTSGQQSDQYVQQIATVESSSGVAYVRGRMGSKWGDWSRMLTGLNVANNLVTTNAGYALDARQGKVLMDEITGINSNLSKICSDSMYISVPHHTATINFIRVGQYCITYAEHHAMGESWDTNYDPSQRVPVRFRPSTDVNFSGTTYRISMASSGAVYLYGCQTGGTIDVTESGYAMYECAN